MIALVAGGAAFALDQLAKEFVLRRSGWTSVLNAGSGRLTRSMSVGSVTVWSLLVLVVAFAAERPPLAGDALALAGLGMALGGAAGNVVDRLRRGGIVDFISVGRWPTFNLADAAIILGGGLALGALV
jgi:signal peptidase II